MFDELHHMYQTVASTSVVGLFVIVLNARSHPFGLLANGRQYHGRIAYDKEQVIGAGRNVHEGLGFSK